jgi:hypothetical protein
LEPLRTVCLAISPISSHLTRRDCAIARSYLLPSEIASGHALLKADYFLVKAYKIVSAAIDDFLVLFSRDMIRFYLL